MPSRRRPRATALASTTSSSTTSTRTADLLLCLLRRTAGQHGWTGRGRRPPAAGLAGASRPAGVTSVRRPMSCPRKPPARRRHYPSPGRPVRDRCDARRAHSEPHAPGTRATRRSASCTIAATGEARHAHAAGAGADDKTGGVASLSGSGQPTATTNAGGSTDPKQAALEFAKCMRQHGIDMPDPKFDANGRMSITVNGKAGASGGPDDPKFKAAQQACEHYLPGAGKGGTNTVTGGGSTKSGGDQ